MKVLLFAIVAAISFPLLAQDSLDQTGSDKAAPVQKEKGLKNKLRNLKLGQGIKEKKQDIAISLALKQARGAENQGDYLKAIQHYQKAIDLHAEQGDQQKVSEYSQHIALLYRKAGYDKQALNQYERVLDRKEALGDTSNLKVIRQQLAQMQLPPESVDQAFSEMLDESEKQSMVEESARMKSLAEATENSQDYKRSLEYFKLYTELNTRLKEEEQAQLMALQEKTFELEQQAAQVKLLKSEKEVQALSLTRQQEQLLQEQTFQRNLFIGLILLAISTLAVFLLYRSKRQALGNLHEAYDELNHTKDKLIKAEEQLKRLLGQQVSTGVAQELLNDEDADRAQKKFVCVMFLDIREFTPFAEKLKPEELIAYQNEVFGIMIDIIDEHKGTINQFLGDGFMATFGLQPTDSNVCQDALNAAKKIISIVNQKSDEGIIPSTRVGIGLHAGNVVAGNVGTSIRKQYSITGNTVITAARIEQLNKEFRSQLLISQEVSTLLESPPDESQEFLKVTVKGRKQPVMLLKIA